MVNFLGKSRKDLLPGNRFTRYLLYAIGEIILVVIGILIALQVNNWNEDRKNNKEEITILKSLQDNLSLAKKQSENYIKKDEELSELLLTVLDLHENKKESSDGISDKIFYSALWGIGPDTPIINTYTDLKNSDRIGLIKNQQLREKFTSLETSIEELKSMLDDRLFVHQLRIDNIAENEVNFVRYLKTKLPDLNIENEPENNYEELLINQRVRNLFAIKLYMTLQVIQLRKNLDNDIAQLENMIKAELNKKIQT